MPATVSQASEVERNRHGLSMYVLRHKGGRLSRLGNKKCEIGQGVRTEYDAILGCGA